MEASPSDFDSRIGRLVAGLGYAADPDYHSAGGWRDVSAGVRHVLEVAFDRIGVVGALCPRSGLAGGGERPLPVVYVIRCADERDVDRTHRAIWSQSVVPLAIAASPGGVKVLNGFDYRASGDLVPWSAFEGSELPEALRPLSAIAIRSASSWRNFAIPSRVDARIGDDIRNLGLEVVKLRPALQMRQDLVTAGIGRMLYLFVLIDRGIVDQAWVAGLRSRGGRESCPDVVLGSGEDTERTRWPARQVWALFDAIDQLLNGAIFPIARRDRALLDEEVLDLVRRVLRTDRLHPDGSLQYSFVAVNYSVVRTETISSIYECFFDLERNGARRAHGAFYTPPFLVDYVLDETDRLAPFDEDSRVTDPACGSGAFLVGAFRRIVEAGRHHGPMTAARLRAILHDCIAGSELSEQAARVARFSLYLTMLDYLPGLKLAALERDRAGKLFPDLRRRVRAADAFEGVGGRGRATHVVGNPPWIRVRPGSAAAAFQEELERLHEGSSIDEESLAELFYWLGVERLCRPDGIVSMVMPAKTLLAPSAKAFPRKVERKGRLRGVTNLVSFRRKLFTGAEEAALVLFASPGEPEGQETVWRYSPRMASQPLGDDGTPWAIVVDRGQVERFHHAELTLAGHEWRRDLLLQPLDRRLLDRLERPGSGRTPTYGAFLKSAGLKIATGDMPERVGLPSEYLLNTGDRDFRKVLAHASDPTLGEHASRYSIPDAVFDRLREHHRRKFGGPLILQPRSGAVGLVVEGRAAFNSSLTGVFYLDDRVPEEIRVPVLRSLAAYPNTIVARYLKSIYGRQWIIDERRFEAEELRRLPFPYEDWREVVDCPVAELEAAGEFTAFARRVFNLPEIFEQVVAEHHRLREPFQNGRQPEVARVSADEPAVGEYAINLARETSRVLGGTPAYAYAGRSVDGFRAVALSLSNRVPDDRPPPPPAFSQETTIHLLRDHPDDLATLVKPDLATAWTVERAVADAIAVMAEMLR